MFRGNPAARAFGMVAAAALLGVGVVVLVMPNPLPDRLVAAAFALSGAGFVYAMMVRPRLEIDGDEVLVVAPVGSKRFPLTDLQSASGGRFLTLHRRGGEDVKVFAIQNANATLILKREGRTQRVAEQLNDLIR